MALGDVLKQLGLTLADIGAQGGQAVAQTLQAQGSPLAYQQQQENKRQQMSQLFQQQQRGTLSAYEQAELEFQKWNRSNIMQQQANAATAAQAAKEEQNRQWVLGNQDKIEPASPSEPGAMQVAGGFYKPRHPQGPTDLVTVPPTMLPPGVKGTTPDGSVQLPFKDFTAYADTWQKLHGTNEQLATSSTNLHNFIDTNIKREDPSQAALFHMAVDNAKTPQLMKDIEDKIAAYNEQYSPAARRRKSQDTINTALGIQSGKRAFDKQQNEASADAMHDFMVKTGTSPNLVLSNFDKDGKKDIISKWIRDGKELPEWLTLDAQKNLTELDNAEALGNRIKAFLERPDPRTITKSNPHGEPFYKSDGAISDIAPSRLQYWLGKDNDLAPLITAGELFTPVAAGRIAKGAGVRAQQFVASASVHTPQMKKDSFKLMYDKLNTISDYFKSVRQNIRKNGNKYGMVMAGADTIEPPEVQERPALPPLPPPPGR